MSQDDLDKLKDFEYREVAETLMYMCQDMDYDHSDHMMELREHASLMFIEGPPKIAELLQTKEFYDRMLVRPVCGFTRIVIGSMDARRLRCR